MENIERLKNRKKKEITLESERSVKFFKTIYDCKENLTHKGKNFKYNRYENKHIPYPVMFQIFS